MDWIVSGLVSLEQRPSLLGLYHPNTQCETKSHSPNHNLQSSKQRPTHSRSGRPQSPPARIAVLIQANCCCNMSQTAHLRELRQELPILVAASRGALHYVKIRSLWSGARRHRVAAISGIPGSNRLHNETQHCNGCCWRYRGVPLGGLQFSPNFGPRFGGLLLQISRSESA